MRLNQPRVWVNRKLVAEQFGGGITAPVLWIYLAGPGRFLFSLWPEPSLGFQKAGVLSGNTLTFQTGASDYRVEGDRQIAPGPGVYNLYVLHEPAWRPKGTDADVMFMIGGAGKIEYLVRKR